MIDPHGKLAYCIGNDRDFVSLDFEMDAGRRIVRLGGTTNSDSEGQIRPFCLVEEVSFSSDPLAPLRRAQELVIAALKWCESRGVSHDERGWEQVPVQFAIDVHRATNAVSATMRAGV